MTIHGSDIILSVALIVGFVILVAVVTIDERHRDE